MKPILKCGQPAYRSGNRPRSGRRPGFATPTCAIRAAIAGLLMAPAVQASEIVITVAGPGHGVHAARTSAIRAGAEKAAAAVNAKGGIKSARLHVDAVDDGCAMLQSEQIARDLAERKVDLVLGHPCARAELAARRVYAETGTIFIASASRHAGPLRFADGKSVFRISGRDERQGHEAAQFLAAHKASAIAIVHDRTRAMRTLAEDTSKALEKAGAKTVITATVIGGDKAFPLLTEKIKSAAAVFFAGFPVEAGLLYSELRKAGSTATFLMSDNNATAELVDTFGDGISGAFVMRPRFALQDADDSGATTDQQIAAADTALAEAAVLAFAAAANAADSVNPDNIARELTARHYQTAAGDVAFDDNGEARRPSYDVYRWTGKTWQRADAGPLVP